SGTRAVDTDRGRATDSFARHMAASARHTISEAERYGKAAEARRVSRKGSELAVDEEEAIGRKLGLTADDLALLRRVLGCDRTRTTDAAAETPLQRMQRAAAECCRLA